MKYSVHFKKDGAVIAGEIDARDYADCRAVMQQMFGNDIVIFQITVAQPLNERGCIPPHTVCPYKEKCDPNGNFCNHRGLNHAAEYSCALARGYRLFNQ